MIKYQQITGNGVTYDYHCVISTCQIANFWHTHTHTHWVMAVKFFDAENFFSYQFLVENCHELILQFRFFLFSLSREQILRNHVMVRVGGGW